MILVFARQHGLPEPPLTPAHVETLLYPPYLGSEMQSLPLPFPVPRPNPYALLATELRQVLGHDLLT